MRMVVVYYPYRLNGIVITISTPDTTKITKKLFGEKANREREKKKKNSNFMKTQIIIAHNSNSEENKNEKK